MKEIILNIISLLKQNKETFDKAAEIQLALWNGEKTERQPLLLQCLLDDEESNALPYFNLKEIHYDKDKMLLNGLRDTLTVLYGGREAVPSVRANMGCGIFPSLFGVKQELFEDKMPWVQEHIPKNVLIKMGPEDLKLGDEFKAGLSHMSYMAEHLEDTGCLVFPMDLQGVFDTAHIVYGDQIFYDLYDDPEFVHHLLDLSCHAIILGMEECLKIIPDANIKVAHYNSLVMPRSKGGIKLSEDTSTLLSKEHIEEFVSPYMHRILKHFGGGYIHYCGKNPHLFEAVMSESLAYGINFGNPEMHHMETVLNRCAEEGKIYYGYIPKDENEPLDVYFRKYVQASHKNGRKHLLLQYSCKKEDRNMVLDAWERANE
ncbi:MAG: hypothetical protein HPY74_02665 [Firmicutes bacterium]|nr:hypothetical protein [Bacillota bacterium]